MKTGGSGPRKLLRLFERAWSKEKAKREQATVPGSRPPATADATLVDPPFASGTLASPGPPPSRTVPLPSLEMTTPPGMMGESVQVPDTASLTRRILTSVLSLPRRDKLLPLALEFAGQTVPLPRLIERLYREGRADAPSYRSWKRDGVLTLCTRVGLLTDDPDLPARLFDHHYAAELRAHTPPETDAMRNQLSHPPDVDGAAQNIAHRIAPRGSCLIPDLLSALQTYPDSVSSLTQALAAYGTLAIEPLKPWISDSRSPPTAVQTLAMELGALARPWVPLLLDRARDAEDLHEKCCLLRAAACTFPHLTEATPSQLNAVMDFLAKPYDYDLVPPDAVAAAIALLASAGAPGVRALGEAYPRRLPAPLQREDPSDHRAWHILKCMQFLGPEAFPALPLLLQKAVFDCHFYENLGPLSHDQCQLVYARMRESGVTVQGLDILRRGGRDGAHVALRTLNWALKPEVVDDPDVLETVGMAISLLGALGPVEGETYVERLMEILEEKPSFFPETFGTLLQLLTPDSPHVGRFIQLALAPSRDLAALDALEQLRPDLLARARPLLENAWKTSADGDFRPDPRRAERLFLALVAADPHTRGLPT